MSTNIMNRLLLEGDKEEIEKLLLDLSTPIDDDSYIFPDFEKVIPLKNKDLSIQESKTKVWGTKFNCFDCFKIEPYVHHFKTIWNTPLPIIETMSEINPNIRFTLTWASEEEGCNCGHIVFYQGITIYTQIDDKSSDSFIIYDKLWRIKKKND